MSLLGQILLFASGELIGVLVVALIIAIAVWQLQKESVASKSRAQINNAEAAVLNHDYDLALACCEEAFRLRPGNAWAYQMRGRIQFLRKVYQQAIKDLTAAIASLPSDEVSYFWRGRTRLAVVQERMEGHHSIAHNADTLSTIDSAIADFSHAIRLSPQYRDAYHYRAIAYGWKGEVDNALAGFLRAIELDPKSKPDLLCDRADMHWRCQDGALALADYQEALRTDPSHARAQQAVEQLEQRKSKGVDSQHSRANEAIKKQEREV